MHRRQGTSPNAKLSCFSPIFCAIDLQNIADIMSRTWAFAIGSDVATDDFGHSHHLDVHL